MNNYLKMLSVAGVACLPGIALADDAAPAAPVSPLAKVFVDSGITVAGYADASYTAFFQKTGGSTSGPLLHEFDTNNNTFAVNQAALTLSYLPTAGFGALVNVITGEDAKTINGAYSGGSSDFALTQAFVQYAVGNLTVIGGRFVTLAGAEVIDDSKNANISRSLLFTNLEPLVHTGVRASYKVNDMFSGSLGVNNTAGSTFPNFGSPVSVATDSDKHKTVEVGGSFTPTSAISVALADYYGVDGNNGNTSKNNYLDLVASWQATSALQAVVNGDYVRTIMRTGTFTGTGVAAYASYQVTDQFKASLRVESIYLKEESSGGGGKDSARVDEVTATADYSPTKNFDLLAEGRIDYGSDGVISSNGEGGFVSSSGGFFAGGSDRADTRKSQPEVLVKAIFKFGTPTGS